MKKRIALERTKKQLTDDKIHVSEVMENLKDFKVNARDEVSFKTYSLFLCGNVFIWLDSSNRQPVTGLYCIQYKNPFKVILVDEVVYTANDKEIIFYDLEDDEILIDDVDFEKHRITGYDIKDKKNSILIQDIDERYFWVNEEEKQTFYPYDSIRKVFNDWNICLQRQMYAEERETK